MAVEQEELDFSLDDRILDIFFKTSALKGASLGGQNESRSPSSTYGMFLHVSRYDWTCQYFFEFLFLRNSTKVDVGDKFVAHHSSH